MAVSYRIVAGPEGQSDNRQHTITLDDAVEPGETMVLLIGHSVTTEVGVTGSVADPDGNLWVRDELAIGGTGRGVTVFSAYCPAGLAVGSTVRFFTTDTNHGESPYFIMLALNSGDSRRMVYDTSDANFSGYTSTPTSPSITTYNGDCAVFGFLAGSDYAAGWWTPGSGWSEIADTGTATESTYSIACQGRLPTSTFSGTSTGTASGNNQWGHVIVSYKAVTVTDPSSVGPQLPTSAATSSESPWSNDDISNPGNVTADDASTASITGTAFDYPDQSYVLKAKGFDFSAIPNGATILGVIVRADMWTGNTSSPFGHVGVCQLLDTAGARAGNNLADVASLLNRPLPTTQSVVHTFGGESELWGNALTAAWVKDPDFGVALAFHIDPTGVNCLIDVNTVTVEVFYEEPTEAAYSGIVLGPVNQSDADDHSATTSVAIEPGQTAVLIVGMSTYYKGAGYSNLVESVDAAGGGTWSQDERWPGEPDAEPTPSTDGYAVSVWSCYMPNGLASGSTISWHGDTGGTSPHWIVLALDLGNVPNQADRYAGSDGQGQSYTNSPDTPAITPSADGCIVFGIHKGKNTGNNHADHWEPATSPAWTEIVDDGGDSYAGNQGSNLAIQYVVQETAASISSTGTADASEWFDSVIVAYKAAADYVEYAKSGIGVIGP